MRIMGIDPGYERLGVAIVEGQVGSEKLIYSECFKTSPKSKFIERLFEITKHTEEAIEKYKPGMFAIENLFLEKNQKTAMRVSEVRGALLFIARKHGLRIEEYTPLQIKSAIVGFGRGDKRQVEMMVRQLINIPNNKVAIDDEYDAIAIALTASASTRSQLST